MKVRVPSTEYMLQHWNALFTRSSAEPHILNLLTGTTSCLGYNPEELHLEIYGVPLHKDLSIDHHVRPVGLYVLNLFIGQQASSSSTKNKINDDHCFS